MSAAHVLKWFTPGNTSGNDVHNLCNFLCILLTDVRSFGGINDRNA